MVVDAGVNGEGGRVMDVVVVNDVADGGGMEGVMVMGVLWVWVDGRLDETALAVWTVNLKIASLDANAGGG